MSLNRLLGLSLVVGSLAWGVLWFGTDPRAYWDSLVYHQHAFQYAGLTRAEADAASWELFTRYGSDDLVGYVTASLDGEPWRFEPGPDQNRWVLQYRMRPAYPAMVAAAYPVLGSRAPLAVSAFVVILFVASSMIGLYALAGIRVAIIATGLGVVNAHFSQWLVPLLTDGLAISLWSITLITGSLYLVQGRVIWLLGLALATLALCFTRPLGILAPAVFVICAVAAAVARAGEWRRFSIASAVAVLPAVAVTVFFAWAGFPGFSDLLQDLPTNHFSHPDVADPLGWLLTNAARQLATTMPLGLLARPLVLTALVVGVVGLLLPGRWWTAPFVAALPVILLSYLVHPVTSELDRTLAPAWISLHLGLALLAVVGAVRWRDRVLTFAERWTRPETAAAP